jgi:hypothetical protein
MIESKRTTSIKTKIFYLDAARFRACVLSVALSSWRASFHSGSGSGLSALSFFLPGFCESRFTSSGSFCFLFFWWGGDLCAVKDGEEENQRI